MLAYYRRASILDELPAPEIFFSATIAGPSYFQIAREQNSIQGESAERAAWSQMVTDSTDLDGVILRAKGIGATGVKLYSDLEKELIERIVVAGRRHDLRVWSHIAVFPAKPSEIVRAGVEVVSHIHDVPWEQYQSLDGGVSEVMRREGLEYYGAAPYEVQAIDLLFQEMAEAGTILDATSFLASINGMSDAAAYLLQRARHFGVRVSTGTDWLTDVGEELPNIHKELTFMVERGGYTPLEAIHSATMVGAAAIGLSDRGEIAEGKRADLLILKEDPTEDIQNLRSIYGVYKNGYLYDRSDF